MLNIANLEAHRAKGKVLILDEIDNMVRNHMVYFKKKGGKDSLVMTGLINCVLAEKVIMTTATISKFEQKYLNMIHSITASQVQEHNSMKSIEDKFDNTGGSKTDIEKKIIKGEEGLLSFINENQLVNPNQPYIVFAEENEAKLEQLL